MAWFRDHVTGRHEVPLSDVFTAERLQRVVTEPETMYGGQSLRYVRHLVGNPRPEASSSLAMMNKYKDRLQREPVVGMVCFWWGGPSDTHGDCGLVVSPLRASSYGTIKMIDGEIYHRMPHTHRTEEGKRDAQCYLWAKWADQLAARMGKQERLFDV